MSRDSQSGNGNGGIVTGREHNCCNREEEEEEGCDELSDATVTE